MTTDIQLEKYLEKYPNNQFVGGSFLGVFTADQLENGGFLYERLASPAQREELLPARIGGYSLIVNYSREVQKGTHWVAILNIMDYQQPATFFDSFGFAPDRDDVILHLGTNFVPFLELASFRNNWKRTTKYRWNSIQLQDYTGANSNTCGEWCCWAVRFGAPEMATSSPGNLSFSRTLKGNWRNFREAARHRFNEQPRISMALSVPPAVRAIADENDRMIRKLTKIRSLD